MTLLSVINVKVSANEPVGVYWATRTLLQMGEQYKNGNLPKGHIRDWRLRYTRTIDRLRAKVYSYELST